MHGMKRTQRDTRPGSAPRPRLWLFATGFLLIVVVGFGVLVRLYQVHEQGWEWRLSPSAAPPKVHYNGRDYDRGGKQASPSTAIVRGRTPGDGVIFASRSAGTPVVIWVRADGTTYGYGLMGGP